VPTFDNELLQALRGEQVQHIPFWEVWFLRHGDLCRRLMGQTVKLPHEDVSLAKKLGWQHMRIGGIDDGLPRAYRDAGGIERYSPEGAFTSLAQLEEIPPLDLDVLGADVEARVRIAHDNGLATIAYVPWCFHSVATSMGLMNFAFKSVDDIDFLHLSLIHI